MVNWIIAAGTIINDLLAPIAGFFQRPGVDFRFGEFGDRLHQVAAVAIALVAPIIVRAVFEAVGGFTQGYDHFEVCGFHDYLVVICSGSLVIFSGSSNKCGYLFLTSASKFESKSA